MDNQHRRIKGYRELSEDEIALMNDIKGLGETLGQLVDGMRDGKSSTRCAARHRGWRTSQLSIQGSDWQPQLNACLERVPEFAAGRSGK